MDRIRLPRRWLDAASGASLAFLGVLCVGAVLLVAAKLQFPGFGSGADPIEIFTTIVVLALGSLRATVHVGEIEIVALPLGALAAIGCIVVWASGLAFKDSPLEGGAARVAAGVRLGLVFAVICAAAAFAFRFRVRPDHIYAGAPGAFAWGLVWGSAFGIVGAFRRVEPLRSILRRRLEATWARAPRAATGVATGAAMVVGALVLGGAALLGWIALGLATGAPAGRFGPGEAGAAALYVVAFAPNLVLAVVALGMGAPVDVGARVTVAGSQVGAVREISLAGWPGGTPLAAFALVLIPAIACVAGGVLLRRRWRGTDARLAMLVAAVTFAVVMAAGAWLADARLGAGLVGRGVARVSIHPGATFVAGLAWAGTGCLAGWELARRREQAERIAP